MTGANSGIGEAAAVAFAKNGAKVFGVAKRQDAVEAARLHHPEIRWLVANVVRQNEVNAAVDAVTREAGRLDVLVNSAGIFL